ncbi:MAG: hypothetical protein KJO40_13635 [Deltaproteobacteria bacterium]|nr:hypothetical protein [Deltaproteobacteria bacterium]
MITDRVQRSRERRQSWRPAGEPFDPRRHEVVEVAGDGADNLCRAFIHTYLWALHRRLKRYLPTGQDYPKATFEVA